MPKGWKVIERSPAFKNNWCASWIRHSKNRGRISSAPICYYCNYQVVLSVKTAAPCI
jgi:hypothetical protein